MILAALICFISPALAAELSGRVVAISDGDTITVLDNAKTQHKIRLMGIDAPEKAQPFGNRSKQNLSYLVYDKPVSVEWTKHDRYGRIVGKVMVSSSDTCPEAREECAKGLDAGLAQITAGLAWHYKQYAKEQTPEDRERYAFAEKEAKAKRAGLWRDKNPVPPWGWRHQRR